MREVLRRTEGTAEPASRRYFRMLLSGYFEGLSAERGMAWRVADSLSLRSFLDLEVSEAVPDHSTLSRTRRLLDGETHAALLRRLAAASGVETPTRADGARFDRSRKPKKTSNEDWKSAQDPDAKIAKRKDGRTRLAHKAEPGVDLDTGAVVAVTVQAACEGDPATLPATLDPAAAQVELAQADGRGVAEVVADKRYPSDGTLAALGKAGVRSYVAEPERGRRRWQERKTGETPPAKQAARKALYANRRRTGGQRGRRLQRRRGEVVERTFAPRYETGGLRRVWVRGRENVRKRVLLQAAVCNLGLLLRHRTGSGTPRSLQGWALPALGRRIRRPSDRWGRLTRAWAFPWTPTALVGSIAHRQAA